MKHYVITALVILAVLPAVSATLTCTIEASTSCSSGYIKYFGLQNDTGGYENAHAQTANYSGTTYANSVCCDSTLSGTLAASCSQGDTIAILSSEDNAHVQTTDDTQNEFNYTQDVCMSHSAFETSCRPVSGSCGSQEACVISLSDYDNAHAGSCDTYSINICCRVSDPANDFISTWKTDNTGNSTDTQITLPLESGGVYNFTVNWGDGQQDSINTYDQAEVTHNYSTAGEYNVTISGTIQGWRFNNGGDAQKMLDVRQWGSLQLGNNGGYFRGASNLIVTANDTLDLSGTTDLERIFQSTDLSTANNFNSWDVSGVTDLSYAFDASSFNSNISTWDVSEVTNFIWIFGDTPFNQNINSWNTSSASGGAMRWFFHGANDFNQPINNFDVSQITDFRGFLGGAGSFNQDLSSWNTSSATSFQFIFNNADSFDQDITMWDVSSVNDMEGAFNGANNFDEDLSTWNVSSVNNMVDAFGSDAQLSTANYGSTLESWSTQNLESNVVLDAPNSFYPLSAADERQSIIDTYNWTINDAGVQISPPTLLTPTDGNTTVFERRPEFTWDNDEATGVYHQINITATGGCAAIPITNSSTEDYNPTSDLCVDEVYEWTVRTCLNNTCSNYASPYNFTIASVLSIEFTQEETDFGTLAASTPTVNVTENTLTDSPGPLVLNNTGNININTSIRALTELWSEQPLNTSYFQFADQDSSSWNNISNISVQHTSNLAFTNTREVELRIQVPLNEPPGSKTSTVLATAEAAE